MKVKKDRMILAATPQTASKLACYAVMIPRILTEQATLKKVGLGFCCDVM
ncbi:MAG: hypothetical protein HC897_20605 [Thermoanaerobaculia bacterium]|nr:hypothetical protein [Thermoanaerobaculia bacterium]